MHNRATLGYVDSIDGYYIFRLKNNLESLAIINLVDTKRETKPANIKLWHLYIGHLGYKSLRTLKDLSNKIDFKEIAPKQLYKNCPKK